MNLYITADQIGQANHGGGSVTYHESEALKSLGECELWGREQLKWFEGEEPWKWDDCTKNGIDLFDDLQLVHFYAGTFSNTIKQLKEWGCKISYTAAAHSIEESRKEHELLGIPYHYPHLTDPAFWKRYLQGYLDADVLIVPSTHSKRVMEGYGAKNRIEIIPHGVHLPDAPIQSLPNQFIVGYMGAIGPDKGLIYLLQAWKKLNYKDAVLKIAGRDTLSSFMFQLLQHFGGGNIQLMGWVDKTSDFYNSLSLYIQPSVSEGFGLEVLEAMAYGRPVLCSEGAGAADLLGNHSVFKSRDVNRLAEMIDAHRKEVHLETMGKINRERAEQYTWDKIQARYVSVWKFLLGENK